VAQPANGASALPITAPRPPHSNVRRAGDDRSWMLGLDERLLSSIVE
jgi:hypothetical protein